MIVVLAIICCMGFSLDAMDVAVKKTHVPVAKEQEQLFWAAVTAMTGELEKAKALVRDNPQLLTCCDSEKRSLLHHSVEKKSTEFSLWLMGWPQCRLDSADKWQRTPLHRAAFLGETAVVAALIKKDVPFSPAPAWGDNDGWGRFWDAVKNKRNTPLHDAIESGADNLAALIEQHNALVDNPNADGNTPLLLAAQRLDEHAAGVLIAAGATVTVANGAKLSL